MPKHLISILSLMVIWLSLNQSTALANEYLVQMTPNEHLQSADVVFAGRVTVANQETWRIDHIEFDRRPPFIHMIGDFDQYRSIFEVTAVWKGDVTARTYIIHNITSTCLTSGYSFLQGEEYIVYARWLGGELHTGGMSGTYLLSAAREDLLAFGAGKPPIPNPSSLADFPRRLTVLFLFLALLGWATHGLRRKYGVQKS